MKGKTDGVVKSPYCFEVPLSKRGIEGDFRGVLKSPLAPLFKGGKLIAEESVYWFLRGRNDDMYILSFDFWNAVS